MVWTRIPRYMAEYANGDCIIRKRRYCIGRKEREKERVSSAR